MMTESIEDVANLIYQADVVLVGVGAGLGGYINEEKCKNNNIEIRG